jgi:two-component sensor histidine kinase
MGGFLGALCDDLRLTSVGEAQPVALRTSVEPVALPVEQAVPVGLIVNEAVANALKHAFPDGRAGVVEVRLGRGGIGDDGGRRRLRLEVADDGVGAPTTDPSACDGGAVRRGKGQGSRLIGALARQLGGSAEWRGPLGTALVVVFPEAGPAAAGDAGHPIG